MPKVTEQHTQARRQQILDAARHCFCARGFHQTTMDEICRTASLSPGAVYRYFAGKGEIIEAMYAERRERNAGRLEDALRKQDARGAFQELASAWFGMFSTPDAAQACRLDVEVWAEALRNRHISESFARNLATVRTMLARVVRRAQRRGEIDPALDAGGTARVVMAFLQGLVLQKALEPGLRPDTYLAAMMAMVNGTFSPESGPGSLRAEVRERARRSQRRR